MAPSEAEVCFIIEQSSLDWANFLKSRIADTILRTGPKTETKAESDVVTNILIQDLNTEASQALIKTAKVVVLFVTEGLIQELSNHRPKEFTHCSINNHIKGLLFYLGVTKDQAHSQITGKFRDFSKWSTAEYLEGESGDLRPMQETIYKIYDESVMAMTTVDSDVNDSYGQMSHVPDKEAPKPTVPPKSKKSEPKSKKPKPVRNMTFKLIPSTVRCEEETQIALCFDGKVSVDEVTVVLCDEGAEDEEQVNFILETEKMNDMTLAVKVPEHRSGMVRILVKKATGNNEELGEELCSADLSYISNSGIFEGLNHLMLSFLDRACAKLSKDDLSKLDNELKSDLTSGPLLDLPAPMFEWLFGMYEFTQDEYRPLEVPTLLHFGAKFGLKELVAFLLDLPAATLASSIINKNHKSPADLARHNDHYELYQMLYSISSLENEAYSYYVMMHGYEDKNHAPSNLKKYYNAASYRDISVQPVIYSERDDMYYLSMSKIKPPVNTERRKKGNSDDDDDCQYDYTEVDPSRGLVKDQGPVAPPRPAKLTVGPTPRGEPSLFIRTPSEKRKDTSLESVPLRQLELIEIQDAVKAGELTIEEATQRFAAWRKVNRSLLHGSFQFKQEKLRELKIIDAAQPPGATNQLAKAITCVAAAPITSTSLQSSSLPDKNKKKGGFLATLFNLNTRRKGTGSSELAPKTFIKQPAEGLAVGGPYNNRSSTESACSSSSSRDSRTSTASDSGTGSSTDVKKSASELYHDQLAKDQLAKIDEASAENPPPLPPKAPRALPSEQKRTQSPKPKPFR